MQTLAARLKLLRDCNYQRDPLPPPRFRIRAPGPAVATAAATRWFRPGFIYIQCTSVKFGTVQLGNCGLRRIGIGHFDEREAARLSCVAVGDDAHPLHTAIGRESRLQIVLGSLITEISDKYVGHSMYPSLGELSLSDCSKPVRWQAKVAAGKHSMGGTDAGKDNMSIPEIPKVLYEAFTFCNLVRSQSLNIGNQRMLRQIPW